jgi:hypothetical protein
VANIQFDMEKKNPKEEYSGQAAFALPILGEAF